MNNLKSESKNKLYWLCLVGFFIILYLPLLPIPFVKAPLPAYFSPLDWGKTIIFRIVLSVILFIFIWEILNKKIDIALIKTKLKNGKKIIYFLTALWGIYLLSTIFSVNIKNTLWGDPFRAGGFVNFSFYIIFGIITFLIIRKKDWQRIWNFSIFIGNLVALVAIFQQLGWFGSVLIPFKIRPGSTLGNPIFLAIYLLLMVFISFSFGIKEKKLFKKCFYFFSAFFFIFVSIFIAQTRAFLAGFSVGLFWFLLFYPAISKKNRIKIGVIILILLLGLFGLNFYLKSNIELYHKIYQKIPSPFNIAVDRVLSVFEGIKVEKSRLSAWEVSFRVLMSRPIFGYGMENFNIGFDKYYDPNLPKLSWEPSGGITEWWDRAHNILFDISITGGIPALIIYLSLLAFIVWELQKTKKENPERKITAHAIQATILAYFVANLFSFDSYSSFILFFLIIGYVLEISTEEKLKENFYQGQYSSVLEKFQKNKAIVGGVLAVVLIFFIYSFNLKPLKLNKDLNIAGAYWQVGRCDKALEMAKNYSPNKKTIIDNYIRIKYVEIIQACSSESKNPIEFSKKAISLLKMNINNSP